jgi:hypothetical protein
MHRASRKIAYKIPSVLIYAEWRSIIFLCYILTFVNNLIVLSVLNVCQPLALMKHLYSAHHVGITVALELACTCIWEAVYITTWDTMDIVGQRMTHPASYCSSNGAARLFLCTKSMTCSNQKALMYLLPKLAYTHIGTIIPILPLSNIFGCDACLIFFKHLP